jgi:hypothetical protein
MADNHGGKPSIDPTANVLALVESAIKRIDDVQRSELKRIEEQISMHTVYTQQLAQAEAKRIDAIRAVDVGAVAIANERAAAQATVLANQVVVSAETLRSLVATTATTMATQLQASQSQLMERISLLERSQYENKGRSGISAPLLMMIAGIIGGFLVFIADLSKYPRPANDTGLGIHGGANAFFPLGEDGPDWAIGQLKAMGFSWVKLLDVEGSSLACVKAVKAAGMEPIVRLYRPTPQPGTLNDAPKTKEAVPLLIAAGCKYYECSNEDNVNWEQKSGTIPADAPVQSAKGFMVDADYIIACGGIPLITAMSPGGHRDDIEYLQKMIWYLKDNWGLPKMAKCAIAVHNAALNHPLDYPFDVINQSAENHGQKLLDPGASNCWLKYQAVHDLMLRETGLDLPVLSTEGGIWPGDQQDGRYPANTKQSVSDGYVQIAKDMAAGKYPGWYLCTGFWLMANRGFGNPDMSFEYQTWFNSDGVWIDAVQAYKDLPKTARPATVIPPVVPSILTDAQIAAVCRGAGFTGEGLTIAVAVALAESGGKADATNYNAWNDSTDRGLFQINDKAWPLLVPTDVEAFDPAKNAAAAFIISHSGTAWGDWATFNAGTYLQYMDRARAVCATQLPTFEQLKNAAWNSMGVAYNADFAFPKYALAHGLGVPIRETFDFTIDCAFYRGQVYIGAGATFVYTRMNDWGNVKHIAL